MNIQNQTPSQFRGIDARTLLTLYSTHAAEEEWFPFIDAIQTLSEYALVEQFLVRKDNNVNIKKNVSGRQEIIYDDFGNKIASPHWKRLVSTAMKKYSKYDFNIETKDLLD
jgi:hypothetical protein